MARRTYVALERSARWLTEAAVAVSGGHSDRCCLQDGRGEYVLCEA